MLSLVVGLLTLQAATPSTRVEWSAPEGCASASEVRASVEAAVTDAAGPTVVHATATLTEDAWLLSVEVQHRDQTARRSLPVGSCAAAAEAVPLVVQLTLTDAQQQDTTPQPEEEPVPPPAESEDAPEQARPVVVRRPTKPPVAHPSDERTTQPAREPVWRGEAGASIGYGLGGIGPGAIASGRLSFGWPRVQLGIRADHAFRRRFRLEGFPGTGGDLSTTAAGPFAAFITPVGPLAWHVAAFVSAGGIRGRGFGGETRATRWVPWATAAIGTGLTWPRETLVALRVDIEAHVAFVQHDFVFDGRSLRTTQALMGTALLGPTMRIDPRRRRREKRRGAQ